MRTVVVSLPMPVYRTRIYHLAYRSKCPCHVSDFLRPGLTATCHLAAPLQMPMPATLTPYWVLPSRQPMHLKLHTASCFTSLMSAVLASSGGDLAA